MDKKTLAGMMDHTLLKADATPDQIDRICDEAKQIGAASVCVNPCWVSRVSDELKDSGVMTCCVIGFPLGANTSAVKAFETQDAVKNGADEVDMVINIGELKSGNDEAVEQDIKAVVDASGDTHVKVIIETCYLTDDEKVRACEAAARAGADFVKTSTGFGTGGAKPEDVALMKRSIPKMMKVKASGGMHDWNDAKAEIAAGADRLGVSASLKILETFEDAE